MNATRLSIVRHTRQFDAMRHFYEKQLGLTYAEGWDHPNNRGALLSAGGRLGEVFIEILDLDGLAVPDTPPVNLELSIEVDDVQAWHNLLAAAGVTIARGIEDTPWGHRSFGIDDPEGLRLWLYEDIN